MKSKPLSKHLETFIATQEIAHAMFAGSRELTNEEYEILQKTMKRTLSKSPTKLPRK